MATEESALSPAEAPPLRAPSPRPRTVTAAAVAVWALLAVWAYWSFFWIMISLEFNGDGAMSGLLLTGLLAGAVGYALVRLLRDLLRGRPWARAAGVILLLGAGVTAGAAAFDGFIEPAWEGDSLDFADLLGGLMLTISAAFAVATGIALTRPAASRWFERGA